MTEVYPKSGVALDTLPVRDEDGIVVKKNPAKAFSSSTDNIRKCNEWLSGLALLSAGSSEISRNKQK